MQQLSVFCNYAEAFKQWTEQLKYTNLNTLILLMFFTPKQQHCVDLQFHVLCDEHVEIFLGTVNNNPLNGTLNFHHDLHFFNPVVLLLPLLHAVAYITWLLSGLYLGSFTEQFPDHQPYTG